MERRKSLAESSDSYYSNSYNWEQLYCGQGKQGHITAVATHVVRRALQLATWSVHSNSVERKKSFVCGEARFEVSGAHWLFEDRHFIISCNQQALATIWRMCEFTKWKLHLTQDPEIMNDNIHSKIVHSTRVYFRENLLKIFPTDFTSMNGRYRLYISFIGYLRGTTTEQPA